ncbi:MAG TPA: aspartyl protease family protein [Blastocatellia bacterium]|nr:aspartyl protease family protein [Blastocatellia bacterium]
MRLPFEHYYGLIFLSVRVNGSEPMSFVFDTGASITIINEQSAARLGLKLRGQRRIAGRDGGEGAINLAFAKGVAIDLGDALFAPDQVGVTSLAWAEKFLGHPMDGILGGDFIRRYVVEIDYAGKALTLYEPKTYHAGHGGANAETLALKMIGLYPCVSARLKLPGREALDVLLGIDTGAAAAGGFSLNSPFVTRHKLIESMPKVFPGFTWGLSGESRGMAGRAESLTLGRTAVLNPLLGFSQATKGANSWKEPNGILGSEILRRFRVTLDYSRKQMRLEPNDSLLDPFESDMSGLTIVAEGADFKTLRIFRVRPDSPAAAADLREGDVLFALDNQPISTITLFKAAQMLQQDGREILVEVRRGAEQLQVRFKLKRHI